MPGKVHFLVYDLRDPGDPAGPKITKARHSSLENAEAQRDVDLSVGKRAVRIEDAKGNAVWEP
jgi:hypothetical protein